MSRYLTWFKRRQKWVWTDWRQTGMIRTSPWHCWFWSFLQDLAGLIFSNTAPKKWNWKQSFHTVIVHKNWNFWFRKLHFIDTPVKQIQHAIYLFAWIAEGVTQRSHSDVIRNDEQLTRTHMLLAWNADRDGSKAGQRNADRCHIRYYVGHPRNHSVPIDARRVGDPLL